MNGFVVHRLLSLLLLSATGMLGIVAGVGAQAPCTPPSCSNCPISDYSDFEPRLTLSPCNFDQDLGPHKLYYNVTVRNGSGQPIEGFSAIGLDFYYTGEGLGCWPASFIPPDVASNADGELYWSDNLSLSYTPNGCGASLIPQYSQCADTWYTILGVDRDSLGGYRNVDEDGDGMVAASDLVLFQPAFTNNGPQYMGDFSRNDSISLTDLGIFQGHFTLPCSLAADEKGPTGVVDGGSVTPPASNAGIQLYLHVMDALPIGVEPPPVMPHEAVTTVGEMGPAGRNLTILVYASGYGALHGVHFRLSWPDEWRLTWLDRGRLPDQVLGYPGSGLHDMAYAAAFNCLTGGETRAVARFDVHAASPGAVAFDRTNRLLRILDCDLGEVDLEPTGDAILVNFDRKDAGQALRRLGSSAGANGADYEVRLDQPTHLSARVYDVSGRLVRVVDPGRYVSGLQRMSWDGRSDRGEAVAAGVYLVEFRFGEARQVERAVIVR